MVLAPNAFCVLQATRKTHQTRTSVNRAVNLTRANLQKKEVHNAKIVLLVYFRKELSAYAKIALLANIKTARV